MKTDLKGFVEFINDLKEKIPLAVAQGFSELYNENIEVALPEVTGSTKKSFKPVRVLNGYKNISIANFESEAPELLERGYTGTPFTVYIPEWVQKKGFDDKFPNGFVRVGTDGTYWGKEENQWFTKTNNLMRNDLNKIKLDLKSK